MKFKVNKLALWLAAVGAINWGLVGLLNFNLVEKITGYLGTSADIATTIVYAVIAIAGVLLLLKK